MAEKSKTTLKALFETGDSATEANFTDLIDSALNLADTTAQTVAGPVTFSGPIGTPTVSATTLQATTVSAATLHATGHIFAASAVTMDVDTTAAAVAGAGAGAGAVPASAAFMKITVNGTEFKLALYS